MNEEQVSAAKREVLAASARLVSEGLVARTWGNVSTRIDGEHFAITPSGIDYGLLNESNIVVVNINDLSYEGEVKPSSEKGLHAMVYQRQPQANCVIHTHQLYATCIGLVGGAGLAENIPVAAYALPGTKKLRKNVRAVLGEKTRAVLLARHGALLTGADSGQAFDAAQQLEQNCRAAMKAEIDFEIKTAEAAGAAGLAPPGMQTSVLTAGNLPSGKIPCVLDDFAQMVGTELACVPAEAEKISRALAKQNAVSVAGALVLCAAENADDLAAVLTITQKNILAFANAAAAGGVKPISFIERKLMRKIYLSKYSKLKGGANGK